jgi:hypothetical protein
MVYIDQCSLYSIAYYINPSDKNESLVPSRNQTNMAGVVTGTSLRGARRLLYTPKHLNINTFCSKIERKNRNSERFVLDKDHTNSTNAMANASVWDFKEGWEALLVLILRRLIHFLFVRAGLIKILGLQTPTKLISLLGVVLRRPEPLSNLLFCRTAERLLDKRGRGWRRFHDDEGFGRVERRTTPVQDDRESENAMKRSNEVALDSSHLTL